METQSLTKNTQRIQNTSRLFIRLFWLLIVLIPLGDAVIWVFINDLFTPIRDEILPGFSNGHLPTSARLMGFGVSLLMVGLVLYTLRVLIRLFRLYQAGMIFARENVHCFRLLSRSLIGWCLLGVLSDPLMSIALTLHHPPGERILAIGFGSPDLTALLVGGILAVITRVMEEARRLDEEQALTV